MIVTEFLENSESVIGKGFLVLSLVQGCKMKLNLVWFRVRISQSQRHTPAQIFLE